MRKALLIISCLMIVASGPISGSASAEPCPLVSCGTDDGIELGSREVWTSPTGSGPGQAKPPYFRYGSSTMCGGNNSKEPGHDELCGQALAKCAGRPPEGGDGPATYVFQRQIDPDTDWRLTGWTCWPELIPGPKTPTMAMIETAFHRTPFASPGVTMQPPGGRTLVTLPTYYQVSWSERGFEPGEIDSLNPRDWFGLDVRVKPLFESVTYAFGDGAGEGPTRDLGGPYPTGGIVHAYESGGVFDVQASAVLTGQVSLNGSAWIDIPGHADVAGPVVPLTVLTARNHLYLPGD